MLWFLFIAARRGFVVESYRDEAVGTISNDAEGKQAMTEVLLRPQVTYEGNVPIPDESRVMHQEAHHRCFIANSVRTEVRCEPVDLAASA